LREIIGRREEYFLSLIMPGTDARECRYLSLLCSDYFCGFTNVNESGSDESGSSCGKPLTSCPISDVLTVAGAKWTVEIMREMTLQPTRTRRFLAHIPGLTMKSLRQRLLQLEYLSLINRVQYDEKPLRVEYSLTDKGRRFIELLNLAKDIADEWAAVKACQCPLSMPNEERFQHTCPFRREARAKLRLKW
jgi:DNA-binding HxlR family transcriptional regulator